MRAIAECCGEEVAVATFAQFKSLPDFCYGRGEITHSQIALGEAFQHPFQILLCEAAMVLYQEGATRKILDEMGRSEYVTEGMQLPDTIGMTERILYTGLHDGSIWLVKVAFQIWCYHGFRVPNIGTVSVDFCGNISTEVFYAMLCLAEYQ